MLMKPPGSRQLLAKTADVEIALAIRLGEAEKRDIQAAAVIEVELVRLVDDGLCVGGGAEIEASCRNPAHHAGFGGERDQVDDVFFRRDAGDAFRHADPKIDNAVRLELHGGTPSNDLALAHPHPRYRAHRGPRSRR